VENNMKTTITGYWTFFCNPKKFEIDKFWVENTTLDWWHITEGHRNYFKIGQKGVIRVGNDYRRKKCFKWSKT
jgi:hypothetical protein